MKRIPCLIVIVLAFNCSISQARNFDAAIGSFYYELKDGSDAETPPNAERVSPAARTPITRDIVLSKFDEGVVDKFRDAWRRSGNGTTSQERVLLILRMPGGTYGARSMGSTNEYKSFTFLWHPATVAVVHTHPNSSSPKPQLADIQLADRFGVLMFTITSRGMYMYDPSTKMITKIQDGLDWLEPASWAKVRAELKIE